MLRALSLKVFLLDIFFRIYRIEAGFGQCEIFPGEYGGETPDFVISHIGPSLAFTQCDQPLNGT
jgi:hypothetical protein